MPVQEALEVWKAARLMPWIQQTRPEPCCAVLTQTCLNKVACHTYLQMSVDVITIINSVLLGVWIFLLIHAMATLCEVLVEIMVDIIAVFVQTTNN